MTAQPVPGVTLKTATANNIHMRYAEIGSGPLVVFCHGWPESWYSWRHQLTAVSAAGFRCVAPDMRGYGGTEAPEPVDQYTLQHLVGDMAELAKVLGDKNGGASKAVIIWDTQSEQIVGNNVYDVESAPPVGQTARFETVSAEYMGGS